jgi:hypothetical protein
MNYDREMGLEATMTKLGKGPPYATRPIGKLSHRR